MNIVRYLPSAQFVVIISSIAISGGLVVAAEKITSPSFTPSTLSPQTSSQTLVQTDWMETLRAIEGPSILTTTTPAITDAANNLRKAALSPNLTDTVARTLLVNLSEAKSQGLGSDIPTQDKLITQAVEQIKKDRSTQVYTEDDLTLSSNTSASLKAYANAVVTAISNHPEANFPDAIYTIGTSTDNGDPSRLKPLRAIAEAYGDLTQELLTIKVPSIFAPLHLKIINNLDTMTAVFGDIQLIFEDPLRGLAGLQLFQALNDETTRVFISIAQQLNQNGILFNKDEPGSAWGSLLSL